MRYEENDMNITFTVETTQPGKWAIIDALEQVTKFWHEVRHHATFKRKAFETITIKIERDDLVAFMDEIKENNDILHRTKINGGET